MPSQSQSFLNSHLPSLILTRPQYDNTQYFEALSRIRGFKYSGLTQKTVKNKVGKLRKKLTSVNDNEPLTDTYTGEKIDADSYANVKIDREGNVYVQTWEEISTSESDTDSSASTAETELQKVNEKVAYPIAYDQAKDVLGPARVELFTKFCHCATRAFQRLSFKDHGLRRGMYRWTSTFMETIEFLRSGDGQEAVRNFMRFMLPTLLSNDLVTSDEEILSTLKGAGASFFSVCRITEAEQDFYENQIDLNSGKMPLEQCEEKLVECCKTSDTEPLRGKHTMRRYTPHYVLGVAYQKGESGIEADLGKAMKHFKIAADRGCSQALVSCVHLIKYKLHRLNTETAKSSKKEANSDTHEEDVQSLEAEMTEYLEEACNRQSGKAFEISANLLTDECTKHLDLECLRAGSDDNINIFAVYKKAMLTNTSSSAFAAYAASCERGSVEEFRYMWENLVMDNRVDVGFPQYAVGLRYMTKVPGNSDWDRYDPVLAEALLTRACSYGNDHAKKIIPRATVLRVGRTLRRGDLIPPLPDNYIEQQPEWHAAKERVTEAISKTFEIEFMRGLAACLSGDI